MLTWLLRHVLVPGNIPVASRERRRLACGLERIAGAVEASHGPHWAQPVIDREVAAACAEPAAAAAALLRDTDVIVADDTLRDIRRFLTDGCDSPLFGRSPADALLAIGSLERRLHIEGGDLHALFTPRA
jgi:hypothetical protein